MRDEQSKRHSNPGRDTTRWSEGQGQSSRDEYQGSSYGRMDSHNEDIKNPGRSYRTDDYNNRGRVQNQGYSQGYDGTSDDINAQSPYEQASYGRDMSDNFSGGSSSRGSNAYGSNNQDQWNQRERQSGFGQSNQQDQSYGQQYGRSYTGNSNQFSGTQQGSYGNSSYGSGSESYQPRGADQGSYGQDTGANSRFQGGYPYGYEGNSSLTNRSQNSDRSSREGMNQGGSLRGRDNSQNQYGQRVDSNYQGHFQSWDNDNQNYRGNDAQKSIYGSAGFGSLGTGNEMSRGRSNNEHRSYAAQNSQRIGSSYHPDAHYGQTSSSSSDYSSSNNLSGKQTPASYYGKGPKSFKRSDDRIREELSEMFTRHHDIDASDIEIEVKDGEVTLSGFVAERRMKYLAEDLAEKSMGVKDVTNNLRVRRESSSSVDSMNSSSDSMSSSSDADKQDKKMNLPGTATGKKGSTLNPNH